MKQPECSEEQLSFQGAGGREIVARFDGGQLSSDGGGALLLREVEQRTGLIKQFAACFRDYRDPLLAIDRFFVSAFVQAHEIHGGQEGRFFHGYYRSYCYLPLYIFCGEHLLCARLRTSSVGPAEGTVEELDRIVAQIRESWPEVEIIIRADSGFCRDDIMSWCDHDSNYRASDTRSPCTPAPVLLCGVRLGKPSI